MLDIHLDRTSDVPIFRQIVTQVGLAVADGELPRGARLPTSRDLSRRLGVNRLTVARAYAEMAAAGLIRSHVGRGTFVLGEQSDPGEGTDRRESVTAGGMEGFSWAGLFARNASRALEGGLPPAAGKAGVISFASLFPDAALFPVELFRRALDTVLRREGPQVLSYGPPAGHPPLRRQIAGEMRDAGMRTTEDEIVVTSGSQQGLDLVARALLDPGDLVLVENPTYAGAAQVFRAYGAVLAGVPIDREGVIPSALHEAVARRPPKLIYLMPNFQNPTGCTLTAPRRRAIVDLAVSRGLAILEDDFGGELRFEGRRLPALKALEPAAGGGQVIYMSTFAKKLLPGLRVGWLAASREMTDRLARLKKIADYSTSLLPQAALHEFCLRGDMERHLENVRGRYRLRRDAMLAAMKRLFPQGVRWSRPEGGLVIWVELPSPVSAGAVARDAEARGVLVSPGDLFFVDGGTDRHLRLAFAQAGEKEIHRGIRILGEAIRRNQKASRTERTAEAAEPLPLI